MSYKSTNTPKTPVASTILVKKVEIHAAANPAKAIIHQSFFDAMPDSGFVRESQLVQSPKRPCVPAIFPFSAATLWRMVKAGTFVKPVKLSAGVTVWKVGEVRAWMAAQAAA